MRTWEGGEGERGSRREAGNGCVGVAWATQHSCLPDSGTRTDWLSSQQLCVRHGTGPQPTLSHLAAGGDAASEHAAEGVEAALVGGGNHLGHVPVLRWQGGGKGTHEAHDKQIGQAGHERRRQLPAGHCNSRDSVWSQQAVPCPATPLPRQPAGLPLTSSAGRRHRSCGWRWRTHRPGGLQEGRWKG